MYYCGLNYVSRAGMKVMFELRSYLWRTARHLISHDSLQENTTIENIVQALHFCAQRNEVFFRFGWRQNDSERFHSSGRHKKETKRSSTSIFLQKVCRNLYFTMNFQFTVYKHVEFHVYKCISLLFTTGVCYVYKV